MILLSDQLLSTSILLNNQRVFVSCDLWCGIAVRKQLLILRLYKVYSVGLKIVVLRLNDTFSMRLLLFIEILSIKTIT
jgi:hypothetical protein